VGQRVKAPHTSAVAEMCSTIETRETTEGEEVEVERILGS
jgi:hypothetical protein